MCEGVRRVLYVHEEFVRSSRDSGYRRTLIPRRRLLLRAVLGAVVLSIMVNGGRSRDFGLGSASVASVMTFHHSGTRSCSVRPPRRPTSVLYLLSPCKYLRETRRESRITSTCLSGPRHIYRCRGAVQSVARGHTDVQPGHARPASTR